MLYKELIELKSATIGENANGVYVADCNYACTLLATMNLMRALGLMREGFEAQMISKFDRMIQEEPDLAFVQTHRIPQSVEKLTGGLFYARLSALGSTAFLRSAGVSNPEKYSLETSRTSAPALYCVVRTFKETEFLHLMAVPKVDERGFLVIDNGEKRIERILPRGTAYKFEMR